MRQGEHPHRLGPNQRAYLEAMQGGAELWHYDVWKMVYPTGAHTLDRARVQSLIVHGYILGDRLESLPNGRTRHRFILTEQAKRALQ